ncbi:hypothetical protein DNTS_009439 [Danionella cerebrum]|uniref:C2H2-type domain-containing protein n=1 Tax=Danionella cerebrum TaxID=2873325 RepID=A0A553PWN9_9TELE|nr:hypothetical protein DNTS_009439 [Danionella translucida]
MWDGSRPGQRPGLPFCGQPRGGFFEGRNGPMPDFRGRDEMFMDRSLMNMRRFDCPPNIRGPDMGLRDMEPPRDFLRPGNDIDMHFRRRFEMEQRGPQVQGLSRPLMDINCRDMQGGHMRGPGDSFMDMRERDRFLMGMPGIPPLEMRRRLGMDVMSGNGDFGMIRDRDRTWMGGNEAFNMDAPPRELDRILITISRNQRKPFESDIDLRNRRDPRDEPPHLFRDNEPHPTDLGGRAEMPLGRDGPEPPFRAEGMTLRDREFPEKGDSPMGSRGRESERFSDVWHAMRDRDSFTPMTERAPPTYPKEMVEKWNPNHGNDVDLGEQSQLKDRDRPLINEGKDGTCFNRSDREHQSWEKNLLSDFKSKEPIQKPLVSLMDLPLNFQRSETDQSRAAAREDKPDKSPPSGNRSYFPEKDHSKQGNNFTNDRDTTSKDYTEVSIDQVDNIQSLVSAQKETKSNQGEQKDQDYRDIDYRTGAVHRFDYNHGDLQGTETDVKETTIIPDGRLQDSGSKDQDYRNAGVQEPISRTIAMSGIPKTATLQQILDAFAACDEKPIQGMKIKNVIPGYSFDTAYVEFLNLEDAIHFMESNQVAHPRSPFYNGTGSVKVGDKTALLSYIQSDNYLTEQISLSQPHNPSENTTSGSLSNPVLPASATEEMGTGPALESASQVWPRNSNLTPEAWVQQVDQQLKVEDPENQQTEDWANRRASRHYFEFADPVFKESKTMIIKNILPTTTVETILKALDPFAYLDERNVRLVKGKSAGSKCFCFVDMDSHEQVKRLVDLLTTPRPIMIDGIRVYAEVGKPLKNRNYKRDNDESSTSLLGLPPDTIMFPQPKQFYPQPAVTPSGVTSNMQGDSRGTDVTSSDTRLSSGLTQIPETSPLQHPNQTSKQTQVLSGDSGAADSSEGFGYGSDDPDLSAFLYDATSGFYYDPQTTLYYDPNSRYFYNSQTLQYLYWDSATKAYVPVQQMDAAVPQMAAAVSISAPTVAEGEAMPITEEEAKAVSEAAPEVQEDEEPANRAEKKEKDEKPRSIAAFKIMKDMERWAKIQNSKKEPVRAPSPILRSGDDHRPSKAADAGFAVFERKVTGADEVFKKPLAPQKQKEEKSSKRPIGSLGMLAADYGAGSDEEEDEKHERQEAAQPVQGPPKTEAKEDKLTDWKKMACLLCRRQFPTKEALIRHQQLSDLHKQNMDIHLKIRKSKKELEALENQEKEMKMKGSSVSPESKRRKTHEPATQNTWAGSSREGFKGGERPGLGSQPAERKKKEPVVWSHATYKQAVRKAMFARFNELD